MKRRLILTVALALVAIPSFGALEYEFNQRNTSDDPATPTTDLTARAIIEGGRSRVDFLGGNTYPPGTYVVTSDAARRLFFVDPTKQWYTEVSSSGVATSLASSNIRIENQKVNVERLNDRPMIAGLPTDHYRLTLTYDITVTLRGVPLKQRVRTEMDSWTTMEFGSYQLPALSSGIRTGNLDLDDLLETERTRIPGFPLRQTVTIRTSFDKPARSKIEIPSTRTITREMWVTKIRETTSRPDQFLVPASYRRADQPDIPAAAAQVLTFEPVN
jgi:hypothetical protein